MKFEWATVKDGVMYIGSFGKEFTNNAGETLHTNNLWVIAVDKDGRAVHIDWTPQYNAMRTALGVEPPGYMIHEAVVWSPVNRRWFVLPRRVSKVRRTRVSVAAMRVQRGARCDEPDHAARALHTRHAAFDGIPTPPATGALRRGQG